MRELNDMAELYKDLEEYGIIGNLETCALAGRDGSIDWLCFPFLESPSVFAAILDIDRGGSFRVQPAEPYTSVQSYADDTNVLRTEFTTESGLVIVTDFMPVKGVEEEPTRIRAVYRKIECLRGSMDLTVDCTPRPDYARTVPIAEKEDKGVVFRWNDESLFLHSPVLLEVAHGAASGKTVVSSGGILWFALQYLHRDPREAGAYESLLDRTVQYWRNWAHRCDRAQCTMEGPWHAHAVRSGLVLKLLTNPDTGAIAAAPTMSLPEVIGGVRNWDYRYAWVRDASFTDQAFFHLGHLNESKAFRRWVRETVGTQEPARIQVLYGLHGEADLEERILDHLTGYKGSRPVRTGNRAGNQKQLDIYGELLNALYDTSRHGEEITRLAWPVSRKIVDHVCRVWNTTDAGIWEVRGGPRHFVYSKLMCWVAVDRGISIAEEKKFDAPVDAWKEVREEIRNAILDKGFSRRLNSFVQSFGSETLDATGLLFFPMGFLPPEDPRMQGTIDAVMAGLIIADGLVRRYESKDGLPGSEGAFILCSFWLVTALALSHRIAEAEKILTDVLAYASPLGLLAEEIDPVRKKQIGNFPQAFSHIGVINSALFLGIAKGKKHGGPKPA